jgi:hypothetical protein
VTIDLILNSVLIFIHIFPIIVELQIDLQQARKCVDFKRMILEAVSSGSTIGMSIPMGYETVLVRSDRCRHAQVYLVFRTFVPANCLLPTLAQSRIGDSNFVVSAY